MLTPPPLLLVLLLEFELVSEQLILSVNCCSLLAVILLSRKLCFWCGWRRFDRRARPVVAGEKWRAPEPGTVMVAGAAVVFAIESSQPVALALAAAAAVG